MTSSSSNRLQQTLGHLAPGQRVESGDAPMDPFASTPLAPPDSIFQLTAAYKADPFPKKVNLGVGAYRDDNGKPWVLPVIREAKVILANDQNLDHEYAPITGLPAFTNAATRLILGYESPAIKEKRVAACQTISGTGANHLAGLFLARFYGPWQGKPESERAIYLSNPTWANHKAIFSNVGLTPKDYPYYDAKKVALDYGPLTEAFNAAPDGSVILLHPCAHNPTGIDPTREQWAEIAQIFERKKHFAFFDCAYQGFASGDLDNDAWAIRHFVEKRIPMLICQSFAKNMGLYGERIGCLAIIGRNAEEAQKIASQVSVLQRSEISNPPLFGARIVSLILDDPELFRKWKVDVGTMANRIIDTRKQLRDLLENKYQTPGSWRHVTDCWGMFTFTGLKPQQSKAMVEKAHIYMTGNGRISMAGLTSSNIDYVAQSIDKAVRGQL